MFTVGSKTGLSGRLTLPRTGAWQADVRIEDPDGVTGAVVINVDEGKLILNGTVDRGGVWQDADFLRVVGGAGGLSLTATARHYNAASVGVVLGDLLRDAGEKLSPTSDAAVLSLSLSSWTTSALPTGQMIALLLKAAGHAANWRVRLDGTIWVGAETWPDSGLKEDTDYQVLSEDPTRITALLGVEVPLVMPGTSLGGRKVSYVEHRLDSPETRTDVWFEATAPGTDDRLRRAFGALVRGANPQTAYAAMFWATIVSQVGETIDVNPVDPTRPSMAGVKLFAGFAQWKLQLSPGGHVLVGWGSGDPTQAFVIGFGPDVVATSAAMTVGGSFVLECPSVSIGTGDLAQPAILSTPYRAAEDALLTVFATYLEAALTSLGSPAGALAVNAALVAFQAASPTFLSTQVKHS